MSVSAFNSEYQPLPRRGFTPIEAVEFMRRELPVVANWTCWRPAYAMCRCLGMLGGQGPQAAGQIGTWTWTRVACSYTAVLFWDGYVNGRLCQSDWVGLLKITNRAGGEFLLFSFLNSQGVIGQWYLASIADGQLLEAFGQAVHEHFRRPDELVVQVYGGGRDFQLETSTDEALFLPTDLRRDIEQQAIAFFAQAERYQQLRIRHQRGILLVGLPGVGKSLLLRHLIRQCHRRFQVAVLLLNITKEMHDRDLVLLFEAAEAQAPALVIIEDLDSLTAEAQVSRSNLLAHLDGLESRHGLLVIGTTNNPEQLDPALVHRPSRFDRVFTLPLPDDSLRYQYLEWALPGLPADLVHTLVRQTNRWTFAYLNELRTSVALRTLDCNDATINPADVLEVLEQLAGQFQSGQKSHSLTIGKGVTGFGSLS